jgi:hypothetical protein
MEYATLSEADLFYEKMKRMGVKPTEKFFQIYLAGIVYQDIGFC